MNKKKGAINSALFLFEQLIVFIPSTLMPSVAALVVIPVAFMVSVSFGWWLLPTATTVFVPAVTFVPVFVNPDVAWTWRFDPNYRRPGWANSDIDL